MPLIKFNNFSFRYKGNENYALDKINLEIEPNKFILLCGETGSGKTTLIRCMNGLIPQFYAGYYKGNVIIDGNDTSEIPISELSTTIGIVFQNPENQLISMNVEHEIAFGLENLGIQKEEMIQRIQENIALTEINHLIEKAPFELSGGEQQRVAIASILALRPKVLILDEPTALLDPYMARKIILLLKKIQEEHKITIIISEHRMDMVLPIADELILVDDGKVIDHDITSNIVNNNNFKKLHINKPTVYNVFSQLNKEKVYRGNIPTSIKEAVSFLKSINIGGK